MFLTCMHWPPPKVLVRPACPQSYPCLLLLRKAALEALAPLGTLGAGVWGGDAIYLWAQLPRGAFTPTLTQPPAHAQLRHASAWRTLHRLAIEVRLTSRRLFILFICCCAAVLHLSISELV